MRNEGIDALASGAKASPPITVAAATMAGMSLQDWVYVLTIIYTLLLIAQHIWTKWIRPWREARKS